MIEDQTEGNPEKNYMKALKDKQLENETLEEKNGYLKFILGAIGFISIIVILFFLINADSHYEKGVKFLSEKNYSEALFEFQKVEPGEKEFKMAQSKINYINGLVASGQNAYSSALMSLAKVDRSDEYYNEAQLLIEKINSENKRVNLESLSKQLNKVADTVIIKEVLVEAATEQVNEAEAKTSVNKNTNPLLVPLQKLITQFEYQYQASGNSPGTSKKEYLKQMDSLYNYHISNNLTRKGDAAVIEINNATESWMQKRIVLVNELMKEKSGQVSETARMIKEEGDRMYAKLLKLLKT